MTRNPVLTLISESTSREWSGNEGCGLVWIGREQGGSAMLDRTMKMLVADDADGIRAIFREVTQRSCGLVELIEASNGRECIKLLSRSDVDLAFIDVYMPEMSGVEA